MSELKPCPLCGETPIFIYDEQYAGDRGEPDTIVCGCLLRLSFGWRYETTKEEATTTWNHRPLEEALEARVKELESELAQAKAAAVQWITYDGTEATRPDRRCNEFNIGVVMFFTPLGGGTTMVAVMRPFAACRFPADLDPEDIPDDFEPDEWVWQRADNPEVVWLAKPGDRWAYLPVPRR